MDLSLIYDYYQMYGHRPKMLIKTSKYGSFQVREIRRALNHTYYNIVYAVLRLKKTENYGISHIPESEHITDFLEKDKKKRGVNKDGLKGMGSVD